MPRRFCYLVNPASAGGRGGDRWRRLKERLRARHLDGTVVVTSDAAATVRAAATAVTDHDVVVAVGGDGTVFACANGIREGAGTGTALAVLPLGSGNDAARMAGIRTVEVAIETLAAGEVRRFDSIELAYRNGGKERSCRALVFAGAGLAADILACTPPGLKRVLGGRFGYIAGFFIALARYRPYPLEVHSPQFHETGPLAAVVAANHTHAGGHTMHIGPGAVPTDGQLDVSIIRGLGRGAVAARFVQLLRGTHIRHPGVTYRRENELRLAARGPVPVPIQADGEILGTTPATFRLQPASVPILTPPK